MSAVFAILPAGICGLGNVEDVMGAVAAPAAEAEGGLFGFDWRQSRIWERKSDLGISFLHKVHLCVFD
jgi:hypothetical protein